MNLLTQNKILLIVLAVILGGGFIFLNVPTGTEAPIGASDQTESELEEGSATMPENALDAVGGTSEEDVQKEPEDSSGSQITMVDTSTMGPILAVLKDVGEAGFDHFGLVQKDFSDIKNAGFDIIEGNFDICADDADVKFFLDSAANAGLKVILNAGAGEAEWGYPCNSVPDPGLEPSWQKEKVREWVEKWKNHSALYAWDTSNEDGGAFPFGTGGTAPDPDWETKYALSTEQLQEAYRDVKSVDSAHPIMIRMNGWYFYDNVDNFFRPGNAFGKDVADIVMINAYSNVDEYFKDFVSTVLMRAARSMYALDADVKILPALGVWEEPPTWFKPTRDELVNDFNQAVKAENLAGVAFFKYGASSGSDWLLPSATRGDPKLWQTLQELIKQ